jgi:hypothetical protein
MLSIFSRFSLLGGSGDPTFAQSNNASSATIEESIDPGTPTGPVAVTARLGWDGSGSLVDGSGDTDSGSVGATLAVNNCSVSFRKTFYSSGFGTTDGSDYCSQTFYVTSIGSASAGQLTVTQTIPAVAVPTRFYVTASVSGDAAPTTSLEYLDHGEYAASGQLSIEVSGVDYTYSSPTFLAVPESGDTALAATAIAALTALARRRPRLPR